MGGDVGPHMMSLHYASMTSSVDIMYHMTCLDTQFVIVALNPELARVQYT